MGLLSAAVFDGSGSRRYSITFMLKFRAFGGTRMKNKAGAVLVGVVGLVVVLACSKLTELSNKIANTKADDDPRRFSLAGKEWSTFDLEQTDISVELPGKPKDQSSPMFSMYKDTFSAMHIYSYDEKDFFSGYTELVPAGKRQWKIKELADTSMAAAKRQAPDLTYTLDIKSETNAKYNGTFTKNGKTYDVRGCCVYKKGKDSRVWAILTLIPRDNADARTAAERIIESVTFKDSAEECE
jgi:hypothetical protein